MIPTPKTTTLRASITGNVASQAMLQYPNGREFGSSGTELGGRVDLGTATTADVTIVDATGSILFDGTVTADTSIEPIPAGVRGPLYVTVANISNSAHTLTVWWHVKK